jgi:iron complex outermembrane receptor protein
MLIWTRRVLATVGLTLSPLIGHAQLSPAKPETADNATPELQEVTVTAQRRSESLQHAALAISAISSETLTASGTTRVQELTSLVPSLQVASAAGPYPLFYVRGVGNFNGNPLSDAALALNLDGVYIARPSASSGLFYDLDRLEVLKGPQGTLYGRNATGGAINVITRKPTSDFNADASVDLGNYSLRKFDAAVNIPFSPLIAMRVAGQTVDHNGYMSDGTDDEKSRAGRIQARVTPTDSISILASGDYAHMGGAGIGATLLSSAVPGFVGGPRSGNTSAPANALYSRTLVFPGGDFLGPLLNNAGDLLSLPRAIYQDNDYWGTSITLDWTTDAGTLTVIPAYRHSHLDYFSTAPGFLIKQVEMDQQTSFEARFASNQNQTWNYILGVYYLDERINGSPIYDQRENASVETVHPTTKSYAGFGRLQYAVTDHFRLTGGLRYTRDDKSINGTYNTTSDICTTLPQPCFGGIGQIAVPIAPVVLDTSHTWDETTWRAGVDWDIAQDSLLYAAVETGFKAGGFFFSHDNPTYKPEHLTAYTLGWKNRLSPRLQVNAEAFLWKYRDQQISHISLDSTGTVIFPTENAGRATMKGIEVDTLYLALDYTRLDADVQYLDAVYDRFVYTVPNLGGPPTPACPASPSGTVFVLDCSGKSTPQAPRWTLNLGIQQTLPLGNGGSVVGEARSHFQTATLTGLEFLSQEVQRGYWTADLSLGYQAPRDRWNLTAYVNNVADRDVIQSTFTHPLAGSALIATAMRPPRTYGARFSVKF